jgi:hypothetical protein
MDEITPIPDEVPQQDQMMVGPGFNRCCFGNEARERHPITDP